MLAPIVLFVYNRPWHTAQTIEALKKNHLASSSELFIYSDAAKDDKSSQQVQDVRDYIKSVTGFKKIEIIERENNLGLANSIIDGVTTIVNKYGKIIVLEDDLVTSCYFLNFMNKALEAYQDNKNVWHISGWNYPLNTDIKKDVFLWRLMNCWGWSTWANRWKYFEKDNKIIKEFSTNRINYLNLDGYINSWNQVILNRENKINTWAIYWYATIVKKQGLCLNPVNSFVDNIGLDGSGIHCSGNSAYQAQELNTSNNINFNIDIKEHIDIVNLIKNFYRKQKGIINIVARIGSRIINSIRKFIKYIKL